MTSTPSTRRQLDGEALWSITARSSHHGRVLAEKGLSEELSGAPDTLVDFHTGAFLFEPFWKTVENIMMYSPAPYSQ